MDISNEDVKRIARRARLRFTDKELEDMRKHLQTFLGYVEKMDDVDTTSVEFDFFNDTSVSELREDEVDRFKSNDIILENVPSSREGFISVPKVIGLQQSESDKKV